jgi:hypothetical protein
VHVLARKEYAAPLAFERCGSEYGERGRNQNIDSRNFARKLRALSRERYSRSTALVHLPIARDERPSSCVHSILLKQLFRCAGFS